MQPRDLVTSLDAPRLPDTLDPLQVPWLVSDAARAATEGNVLFTRQLLPR